MPFSTKKVLCWDKSGEGIEHAIRLGKDFSKVYYFTPWEDCFLETTVGKGLEYITREDHFFKHIDEVDLICFLDSGEGILADWLRKKDYRVFGAGRGEVLEDDRYFMRGIQKSLGLPTQRTEKIVGTTALRDYLARHKDKVLKVDIFRRDMETIPAAQLWHVDQEIHRMNVKLGPWRDDFEFILEDHIEGIEPGFDTFFNGTNFVEPYLWGFAVNYSYLGKYSWNPPYILTNIAQTLQSTLKHYGYRGALSSEVKATSGTKAYLIDMTCRFPYPLSLIYTESIKNYSEVIWAIAGGEEVVLEPAARYVGMATLPVEYALDDNSWAALQVRSQDRNRAKLQRVTRYNGHYYAIPGEVNGFVIIGIGNSIKAVEKEIKEVAERVDSHELSKCGIQDFEEAIRRAKEAEEMGVFLDGSDN